MAYMFNDDKTLKKIEYFEVRPKYNVTFAAGGSDCLVVEIPKEYSVNKRYRVLAFELYASENNTEKLAPILQYGYAGDDDVEMSTVSIWFVNTASVPVTITTSRASVYLWTIDI